MAIISDLNGRSYEKQIPVRALRQRNCLHRNLGQAVFIQKVDVTFYQNTVSAILQLLFVCRDEIPTEERSIRRKLRQNAEGSEDAFVYDKHTGHAVIMQSVFLEPRGFSFEYFL